MSCRQINSLLSAYIDSELSGREMLEIRDHLESCSHCEQEWRDLQHTRRLLRGLKASSPSQSTLERIIESIDAPPVPLTVQLRQDLETAFAIADSPLHGRRLAAALALSSVALLSCALPFAPPTIDSASRSGSSFTIILPSNSASLPLLQQNWASAAHPVLQLTSWNASPPPVPDPYIADASADSEPLNDQAVTDYQQSNVALTDYQTSSSGQ